MREWQSLAHVKGECKYHGVIVPKYRGKALFGHVRKRLGNIFRQLCHRKEIELVEDHALLDYVHRVLSIPPKLSVAMAVGYLKGKSAIQIHCEALNVKQGFTGKHFWSRGYCVSTVGLDEQMIRAYVKNQEDLDRQENLFN
jgi:putative transposase